MGRDEPIRLLTWNAHSLFPKKLEFYDYLIRNKISIATIVETHLRHDKSIANPHFRVLRLDRESDRRGGGIALIIRRGIRYKLLPCPPTDTLEALSAQIYTLTGTFVISAIYNPGARSAEQLRLFKRDIRLLSSSYINHIITGDFNARHSLWGCSRSNGAGRFLYEHICNNDLVVYNPAEPTHYPENGGTPSTLELFLVRGSIQLTEPLVECDLSSDHVPIVCEITEKRTQHDSSVRIKDFDNANWIRFGAAVRRGLSERTGPITTRTEVDRSIDLLTQAMLDAEEASVPVKTITPGHTPLPATIQTLRSQRNAMNRRWQRTRNPLIKQARDDLNRQIQHEMAELTNRRFGLALERINDDPGTYKKKLWRITKTFKQRPNGIPYLVKDDRRLVSDHEKADAFAEQFASVYASAADHPDSGTSRRVRRRLRQLATTTMDTDVIQPITTADVKNVAKTLKNKTACGPDRISNRCIKNLPPEAIQLVTDIFNACLHLAYFPKSWKNAAVITIRKPGKPARDVASYRPISLLSALGKLFERLVLPRIQDFIDDNTVIKNHQYGFRSGRSTTLQLYRATRNIQDNLRSRMTTGMLAIDLKAAFDSVWHEGLIYKLSQIGLPVHLIKLIQSYLEDRNFCVRVGSQSSQYHQIATGVPQGAVWSPLLFNVFTYDLPNPKDTTMYQFADDTAATAQSHRTPTVIRRLQKAANVFSRYFHKWRIKINPSKSETCLFTRKVARRHQPRINISIDGVEVPWANTIKYLGVRLDKRLTYRHHIEDKIKSGEKMIRALYPVIGRSSKLNLEYKILMFKTILRPASLYACPVWSTCAATHIKKLQRLQSKILKLMLNVPVRTSTIEVHQDTGVELTKDFLTRMTEAFRARGLSNINRDVAQLFGDIP